MHRPWTPFPTRPSIIVVDIDVLVHYDRFPQALTLTSIGHMMSSGGRFLANTVLPAQHPPALEFLGRHRVCSSSSGACGDDAVVYRRK